MSRTTMTPKKWITAGVASALTFGAMDAAWLGLVAGPLYRAEAGHLLAERFDPAAAFAFYLLHLLGLLHFSVRPDDDARGTLVTMRDGAIFGLCAYATWGLTGKAVIKDFPWSLTLADMAWGAAASAVVAGVARVALRRLRRRTAN